MLAAILQNSFAIAGIAPLNRASLLSQRYLDMNGQPSLAAVILTKNEAIDIVACLVSCKFCDRVIVLDSESTDNTCALAEAAGAEVHVKPFINYADQRNTALSLAVDADWVLMMDADERVPADMAVEVRVVASTAPQEVALYRLRRKDFFFGHWMRRATGYPTWAGRLMRPRNAQFVRDVNEELQVDGTTGFLDSHFHHFPFSKGVAAWVDRHNKYSSLEAQRLIAERSQSLCLRFSDLFDLSKRRRLAKQIFYRLPCRPFLAFVGLYFVRGGFLDGWAGLQYCRLRALYEFMIYLKMRELSVSQADDAQECA